MCIALLSLTRDLGMKLGAVILADVSAWPLNVKTPSGDLNERQISPLEAASSHTNIPWPTSGVIPLWGLGGEPRGHEWPDCCRFMVLPESQSQWLILLHGSITVILADVGLTATDKTWHNEQWLHLKFAGRKRRRDAIPCGLKVAPENCTAKPTGERLFVLLSHP